MSSKKSTLVYRYYIHATEQELFASGVEYGTSVEFKPAECVFEIFEFQNRCRTSAEWIIDVQIPGWAEMFKAKHPECRLVELHNKDVIRNEEWSVFVTLDCTRRIFTASMQDAVENIMLNIGYGKPISSSI